jgi:hypothetical protein
MRILNHTDRRHTLLTVVVLAYTSAPCVAQQPELPAVAARDAHRVAVLLTDWAEPEGFDEHYRKEVVVESIGERATSTNDPCTAGFIGQAPFRVQMGLVPYAIGFETKGVEGAHDSMGLYRLSADGRTYISIYDPKVTLDVRSVPSTEGMVRPARDVPPPLARSFWAIDPRDGTNYLDGVFQIGRSAMGPQPNPLAYPNGIRDADEYSYAAAITDFNILHENLAPRLSRTTEIVYSTTAHTLQSLFGDSIVVREGAYASFPPHTRRQDEVAVELARAGYKRFVLTRETTDNNNYANNFMTRSNVGLGLCRAGFGDGIAFRQARQVGRTPEYNLALLHVAKQNLDNVAVGSEVAILYTTYGLPFPGREAPGPFAAPHPWAAEVYHENAYNNYIAFKRYLEAYYGDRYRFVWNPTGATGDKRRDNFFSYGIFTPEDSRTRDPELRFRTLRENIDRAKRDGRREIIAVLSHWYYNGRDPLLAVRVMQKIPLQTREEVRAGKLWKLWCERVDSPEPVPCNTNDPNVVRLQYSETFDSWAEAFGIGYAHVIRGAVERFGVLPRGVTVAARGAIDRTTGGTVRVDIGPLRGAALRVAPDAHPGKPESFTIKEHEVFDDPADNFVSAWDDFEGYIGSDNAPVERADDQGKRVSPAILFGPYRTIVNRPATITLPVRARRAERARLRAFVLNEVSLQWEPVFPPAGGAALTFDKRANTVSFDTQVFGTFVVLATKPGWTPRDAAKHPPSAVRAAR